jgi:hypothetical protein
MSARTSFANVDVSARIPEVGQCTFRLNARRLERATGLPRMILLVIADMTNEN